MPVEVVGRGGPRHALALTSISDVTEVGALPWCSGRLAGPRSSPSNVAFGTPLSPPPLDDEPGPATELSGDYPGGTRTRWADPAFRTHHGPEPILASESCRSGLPARAASGARMFRGSRQE